MRIQGHTLSRSAFEDDSKTQKFYKFNLLSFYSRAVGVSMTLRGLRVKRSTNTSPKVHGYGSGLLLFFNSLYIS